MQVIPLYLNIDGHVATPMDAYNAVRNTPPALMRGVRALLCLRLVDDEGNQDDSGIAALANWEFVLAGDWNTATTPEIRVSSGIAVVKTTVGTKTYNEIQIPLTELNTEELISKLGNNASADLGAELVGFEAGETDPGFLIQFTMRVYNRRSTAGTGTPTPVDDGLYSAVQIDSLLTQYYTSVQVDAKLSGYALTGHNHDAIYAAIAHTHTIGEVVNLQAALDAKADTVTVNTHIADANIHTSTAERAEAIALGHAVTAHMANTENPHAVTKSQVGLDKVDNTSDLDKPVSTAQLAALNGKLTATFSGIQAIVNSAAITYYSTLEALLAYLNTLDTEATEGIIINFAPADYSMTGALAFPAIRMVLNGNNSELIISGELSFTRNVIIRNFSGISAATLTFHNANIDNAELTGTMVCLGSVSTSFVNVTGDVTVNSASKELVFSRGTIAGKITSIGSLVLLDAAVYANSDTPAVSSSGGAIRVLNSVIINTGTGGGISCDNGATAASPNMLADVVIMNGTLTAGTAVTLLGVIYASDAISGSALVRMMSKADIGLGNVDNTADLIKPVSIAQQAALDGKAAIDHNHDTDYAVKSSEHVHANLTVLEKFSENIFGNPLYDGKSIVGSSSSGGALLSSDFFAVNPGVAKSAAINGGGSFTGGLTGIVDYATALPQNFLTSTYQVA